MQTISVVTTEWVFITRFMLEKVSRQAASGGKRKLITTRLYVTQKIAAISTQLLIEFAVEETSILRTTKTPVNQNLDETFVCVFEKCHSCFNERTKRRLTIDQATFSLARWQPKCRHSAASPRGSRIAIPRTSAHLHPQANIPKPILFTIRTQVILFRRFFFRVRS